MGPRPPRPPCLGGRVSERRREIIQKRGLRRGPNELRDRDRRRVLFNLVCQGVRLPTNLVWVRRRLPDLLPPIHTTLPRPHPPYRYSSPSLPLGATWSIWEEVVVITSVPVRLRGPYNQSRGDTRPDSFRVRVLDVDRRPPTS